MNNDFTEYVLVLETHNAGDRVFIKSIFDAEGIVYFIQGENVAPYLFNALPMRVMVKKDQVEKAKDILKDIKLSYSYSFREDTKDINNKE
jgi:hypothetical protein